MAPAPYRHTQRGVSILAMVLVTALIAGSISISMAMQAPKLTAWLLLGPVVIAAVLIGVAWYFSSMTVEVTDRELRWNFGAGRPYSISRSDIEDAGYLRHPLFHGYGIRWIGPNKWTYIVSGRDLVEVRLKDGGWRRIGTNDARGLLMALHGMEATGGAEAE